MKLRPDVNLVAMSGGIQLRRGDDQIRFLRGDPTELEPLLRRLETGEGEIRDPELFEELSALLASDGLLVGEPPPLRAPARIAVVGHAVLAGVLAAGLGDHGQAARAFPTAGDQVDEGAFEGTDLVIAAVERPDLTLLDVCNARAVERRRPTLFVDLSHGRHATIGPLYLPGETGCFACFRTRLLQNSAAYSEQVAFDEVQRQARAPQKGMDVLPAYRQIASGVVTLEVLAFLSPDTPVATAGGILTVDFGALEWTRETVWQIPWCPACHR